MTPKKGKSRKEVMAERLKAIGEKAKENEYKQDNHESKGPKIPENKSLDQQIVIKELSKLSEEKTGIQGEEPAYNLSEDTKKFIDSIDLVNAKIKSSKQTTFKTYSPIISVFGDLSKALKAIYNTNINSSDLMSEVLMKAIKDLKDNPGYVKLMKRNEKEQRKMD